MVADPQTVQELVLARLWTKTELTRAKVVTAVAAAISTKAAKDAAVHALATCEADGLVAGESRPVLTAKGRKEAQARFGKQPFRRWEHARQRVALNVIGRAADRPLRVDGLAAVVLADSQNVPVPTAKLSAVVDYLAWRALGVETTKPFHVDAVKRHLLRALVPADVRVNHTTWQRMLAMRSIQAQSHDAVALERALLAQRPNSRRQVTAPANTNDRRKVPQPSLADFAAAVRQAARLPTVARFHDDRAFIGSVWDHMRGRRPVGEMPLAEFKQRLIAAHRDGLLRITRADLVGAMDRDEVERSEAQFRDATFHFVALEAGGAE